MQFLWKWQKHLSCYLDADDLWHPEKIEDQLNLMESDNYSLVYSGIKLINLKGEEIGSYMPEIHQVTFFRHY